MLKTTKEKNSKTVILFFFFFPCILGLEVVLLVNFKIIAACT